MKKLHIISVVLVCALLFCACGDDTEIITGGSGKTDKNSSGKVTGSALDPFQGGSTIDPAEPTEGGNNDPFNLDNGGNGKKNTGNGNSGNGSGSTGTVSVDPFGVSIPSGGGVNYEYEVESAFYDNGNEAGSSNISWFISYSRDKCEICIPIWSECRDFAIGTMLFPIPPNFTEGSYEFTAYGAEGEVGGCKTLKISIYGQTATVYNVDDHITYNCTLYRTFSYGN